MADRVARNLDYGQHPYKREPRTDNRGARSNRGGRSGQRGATGGQHFCSRCRATVPNNNVFCGTCGLEQGGGARCPQCRRGVLSEWAYCEACGCAHNALAQPDPAPAQPQAPAPPQISAPDN